VYKNQIFWCKNISPIHIGNGENSRPNYIFYTICATEHPTQENKILFRTDAHDRWRFHETNITMKMISIGVRGLFGIDEDGNCYYRLGCARFTKQKNNFTQIYIIAMSFDVCGGRFL